MKPDETSVAAIIENLQRRVADLEAEVRMLQPLKRIQFDPGSGSGEAIYGDDNVMLRFRHSQ